MMRPHYQPPVLCALLPCLLFMSACAPTPAKSDLPEPEPLVTQPFISNNQPEKMVELYQHAEGASFFDQNRQRLQTIESFIQAGDGDTAKRTADAINPDDLSFEQRAQLSLLYAQILLSFGEAERAIEQLAQIQPGQLSQDNRVKFFQSQAFAYSLAGNLLEAAKSRIALHPLISSPLEREKNQAAILEALRLLPDTSLATPQTDVLSGWMALSGILKAINQPDFNAQLNLWRITFPGHPADLGFLGRPVENAVEKIETAPPVPSATSYTIALVLPGSGTFAPAGKAIRAGFMAAYDHADKNLRPILHFYDSEQSNPQALYKQAVAEGAQLIIGPLAKEQIQSLADSMEFTVPVLALNHIPGLQKEHLYQFSLSPLDDVGQITQKAWDDGHRNVLLLIPDNAPGKRIGNYLTEFWQKRGGTVLETQSYNPKETDFSATLQKLLKLDGNPNAMSASPQRRQDADAILLSAYSAEARSINPQLQFYGAGDLPVYAMPTVYSGQTNPALDADLNKITFCDTPWLFNGAYQGELGMEAIKDIWKPFSNAYLRLIAMGIDAYSLSSRLDSLATMPFSGATGNLSLTADQRIRRDLACAKFIGGQPELR